MSSPSEPMGGMTIEEYERLEEPDDYRSELVRGTLVREPRPGGYHGRTQARLTQRLDEFVERQGLGAVFTDVGVVLSRALRTVRGPDVAFYSTGRMPAVLPAGFLEIAPDLCVEVLSPSNSVSEIVRKVMDYLDAGTSMVWVVDPFSRTATVYRSRDRIRIVPEDGILEGEEVVPGFRVPLADVLP